MELLMVLLLESGIAIHLTLVFWLPADGGTEQGVGLAGLGWLGLAVVRIGRLPCT